MDNYFYINKYDAGFSRVKNIAIQEVQRACIRANQKLHMAAFIV